MVIGLLHFASRCSGGIWGGGRGVGRGEQELER